MPNAPKKQEALLAAGYATLYAMPKLGSYCTPSALAGRSLLKAVSIDAVPIRDKKTTTGRLLLYGRMYLLAYTENLD